MDKMEKKLFENIAGEKGEHNFDRVKIKATFFALNEKSLLKKNNSN